MCKVLRALVGAADVVDSFQTHCAPHIPLLPSTFDETRQRSTFLFTSMLAAAHVNTPIDTFLLPSLPSDASLLGDRSLGDTLAHMALNCAAGSLLRRQVCIEDIIAVLLLALWNTRRSVRAGPSSWPLIGHAQRMARRIGIHDAGPLSQEWLVVSSLDVYDHL
jgi:hypothetical protein